MIGRVLCCPQAVLVWRWARLRETTLASNPLLLTFGDEVGHIPVLFLPEVLTVTQVEYAWNGRRSWGEGNLSCLLVPRN